MSGHTESDICPECGDENMNVYSDYKPHAYVAGNCIQCGFYFYTADGQMDLEELNEAREERNEDWDYEKDDEEYLHPLKKLPNEKGGAL